LCYPSDRRLFVKITPNGSDTGRGPAEWFTGDVYVDEVDETGNPATWGDHVKDEEYEQAPEVSD
jgi:hypothetical protein